MFLAFIAAATIAAGGSVTPASGAQTAPAAPAPKAKDASTETVCWMEAPVGSHLPKRYCAPRSYLEGRTERDQEALSPFYHGGPTGGGGAALGANPASASSH